MAHVFLGMTEWMVLDNMLKFFAYISHADDMVIFFDEEYSTSFIKTVNPIHPNLSVFHEEENDNLLPILFILPTRRPDRTLEHITHHEAT